MLVVEPADLTVSLRDVDVLRFDPGQVILSQGLEPGEIIVSGGIQALHPRQRVVKLPAASGAAAPKLPEPPS